MKWFTLPGIPSDLLSSLAVGTRRLIVENCSTALAEGRSFRLPYEFSINSTPVVLRFNSLVTFKLTTQILVCDQGNVKLLAYRNGTPSGSWTNVPTFEKNIPGSLAFEYTSKVTITTGGNFNPGENLPVDILRVRTSGSTAQRSTASFPLECPRILPSGEYFLTLQRMDGNDTATGVYLIEWDEL